MKQNKPCKQNEKNLDDGPLVIVPDNVSDGFQRIQEPHKGGIWPTKNINENHETFQYKITEPSYNYTIKSMLYIRTFIVLSIIFIIENDIHTIKKTFDKFVD